MIFDNKMIKLFIDKKAGRIREIFFVVDVCIVILFKIHLIIENR